MEIKGNEKLMKEARLSCIELKRYCVVYSNFLSSIVHKDASFTEKDYEIFFNKLIHNKKRLEELMLNTLVNVDVVEKKIKQHVKDSIDENQNR